MTEPFIPPRIPAGELVSDFMEVLEAAAEEAWLGNASLEEVAIELPLELELDVRGGRVEAVRASPPTQRTETTVMPVLHRLRLRGGVDYVG